MVLQAEPTPGGLDVGAGPAPASLPAHLENSLLPRAVCPHKSLPGIVL